jgi:hypothetical protein
MQSFPRITSCLTHSLRIEPMNASDLPLLDAAGLISLARSRSTDTACENCSMLVCPGWESLPGSFDERKLRRIATLRRPDVDDPVVEEFHPAGTGSWSTDAPIAPGYFPYNRCDVWECATCRRPFLRYTEYGGYYQEARIRELDASLVVDAAP